MKDRYLFRGKITAGVDKGEWIVGDFVKGDSLGPSIRTHDDSLFYNSKFVDEETIGQCTGMEDKNGKLIFEGDKLFYAERCEECYEEKEPQVYVTWSDENHEWETEEIIAPYGGSLYEWKDSEIIGSIHD